MVSFNNRKEAKVSRVLHPPKSCFHLSVFSVGNCQRFWSDAKAVLEQHEHLLLAHFSCRWGADFEKRSEFTLGKERKKRIAFGRTSRLRKMSFTTNSRPPMPKHKPPPLPEGPEDWTTGHERVSRSRSPSPFLPKEKAGKYLEWKKEPTNILKY